MNRFISAIMGQESSQVADTGSADTPADPTRTPSSVDEPDTTNHMFSQIADAMDASQNRRKSQLLQANSPGATQDDIAEVEEDAHSPELKKKKNKRKDRHSGEHGETKRKSKKDKHKKSLDADFSQLISNVETFETEEQPSQLQPAPSKALEPVSDEQLKSGSKKQKHRKFKDVDNSQAQSEAEQVVENATEEQAQPDEVQATSASQHKLKSERRKHKKSRDIETEDTVPEEEFMVTAAEPMKPQEAILSPPSEERSMHKAKRSKKEKRTEKKSRQLHLSQLASDARATSPEEQSTLEESVLEPASPAMTPAAEARQAEAAANTESVDVIPESSLPFPATPGVGYKKKIKTFKSDQKKKILLDQIDEQDAEAIPPTQPSQAEETQVQNSYEPKDADMADARESSSESPAMSDAGLQDKDQEVEAEEEEEPEVVVEPKKSKKSKAQKKQKRRLPVDDATDTPSKRARLDIQAPAEPEPTKSMIRKAKRKAKLAEHDSDDEKHEGVLSKAEWDVIDMQLEKYRGMHDMTVEEQNRVIQRPVSGKDSPANQLFTWVMEEIHHRKRWSVIHAMRRKYHNFDKRGAWAPEDDEELMALHARFKAQWKEIGSRLNRHPDDCRDRYRYVLVCGTNIHWGRWSLDEEQLLQTVVEDILRDINKARQDQTSELDAEERAKFYEDAPSDKDLIDWDEVSARMGRRRGPRQCSEKFKKLQTRTPARWAYYAKQEGQAVLQASEMRLSDKINLLHLLQEAAVTVEDEIDWDGVAARLIELDSEGSISNLTPKFSAKSAEKAWQKLKYLLENANSLEFQEALETVLDRLNDSGDEDPSKKLFQPRIGGLDVHQKVRKDLKPAKRSKHNVIVAATMTLDERRHLLVKLQKSGVEKEDDLVWPEIFPISRGVFRTFAGGWESKKLAWELLSSSLDSTEEETPAKFQDRVSLVIEKLDSADGQDPTKELFMKLVEKKSLQDELKKWEKRKSSSAKEEAAEKAAKEKIAKMPASAKLKVLEALSASGVKEEKDIVWTKHGHLPFMKKCTYNAHAQNVMLQELKATVEKVEDYEFQDLIDHLITELSGYTKEERHRQTRTPRGTPMIRPEIEGAQKKADVASSARRSTNKSSKLSKKVLEESDDEVDKDVVESLNAAANSQGDADAGAETEVDEEGQEVTMVQTPTLQSSPSAENSASAPPVEDLRKDLYEFNEDEMEETMLKSAMKKRKTPKKLSTPSSPEVAEDESMSDASPETDDADAENESATEMSNEPALDVSPEAEDEFVNELEREAEEEIEDELEDSISQFAALRAQRRKDIQKRHSSVVEDSEDERAAATADIIQPSQPPPSSPPLTLAEKKRRKRERKEERRNAIAETQEETISVAAEKHAPREIVRGPEDFIQPYMSAKMESNQEKRASGTAVNDEDISPAAEASADAPTATEILDKSAAIEDAADVQARVPTSPVEAMSENRKKKKAKKERRRSEVEETQQSDGPSALDVLVALGSQKKASPPKVSIEDAIPPTSSLMPTMSQVIKQSKKNKKSKRHSDVAPIPEAPETQEEVMEAQVVAEEVDAIVTVEAEAPSSSVPAPFPDVIDAAAKEMPPPSSIQVPFLDIAAFEEDPVPSSVPPPSSPPLSGKQKRKMRRQAARSAAQSEADAPARPATPSPEEAEPVSNLARSLRKAKRSKREAETSVEELAAQEEVAPEAPATGRKVPRVSVPMFTPRASKRERKPTHKAMTPYK